MKSKKKFFPNSGFGAILKQITGEQNPEPLLGHTFVGYRLKGVDEFLAVFKYSANPVEICNNRSTCERIVKNTQPSTESHEAAKKALKHWPAS